MTKQTQPIPHHLQLLREQIKSLFNLPEFRQLCFDLGVDYEEIAGDTKSDKVVSLLLHMQRREQFPTLIARLDELRPGVTWAYQPSAEPESEPPYKGMHYFTEQDAPLFFGREEVVSELVDHLRQHRFLAGLGASGSGKSSVVRAGVVTAVRQGAIERDGQQSDGWPIHIITPGDEPLKALAATLTRDAESVTAMKTLIADMQADSESLDLWLYRELVAQETRLLLVVDQFEELFTQCDDEDMRRQFVENLVHAVSSGKQGRLTLVLTLRADFYAYAVQFEALRPLLETRQKIIGAMTRAELQQAIEAPAEAEGWTFQPGLVETILADVGASENRQPEPGALPLLSHALLETWQRREGRMMTLAGYQAAGGVRRAIATTADTVYAQLTPEQQAIARNIFLRLTELGEGTEDTRRRVQLDELLPQTQQASEVKNVLAHLADKRLVTTDEDSAEVAHEALIREWPTLRKWLDENREGLWIQRQLTAEAREWQATGEDSSYLFRGARLAQAQEWTTEHGLQLNELEWRFLVGSETAVEREEREKEVQRQRELEQAQLVAEAQARRVRVIRQALIGILVLLAVAVGSAIFGFVQSGIAQSNFATAEYNEHLATTREAEAELQAQIAISQALAASSLAVQAEEPMRSLLLAIAAGQTADTPLAYNALHDAMTLLAKPQMDLEHAGYVSSASRSNDGSQVLTWGIDVTAKVWDMAMGAVRLQFTHKDLIIGAIWNEEEDQLLTWSEDGTSRIWDTETGAKLLQLTHEGQVNGAMWNSDESQILTWSSDGTARMWDSVTGSETLRFTHDSISGAAWNKAGTLVLTWSHDGTISMWDASTGMAQVEFTHDSRLWGAAWNGDGSKVVTWGCDESGDVNCILGRARVWDAITGKEQMQFTHEDVVLGVTWNSDESQILTWGADSKISVWDAVTGVERLRLTHEGLVYGAMWNNKESQILTWSKDGTARVWDAATGVKQFQIHHEDYVFGAVWSSDESQVLTWSRDGTAKVSDAITGIERKRLIHENFLWGAAWNRNGSQVLTWGEDNKVRVWDVVDIAEHLNSSNEYRFWGAAWNGNGSQVLTWGEDGAARIWDLATGEKQSAFTHQHGIWGAAWNGNGSQVLTWGCDHTDENNYLCTQGSVRVWNIVTELEQMRLVYEEQVAGAVWNEDESQILIWGKDGIVRVWDTISGNQQLQLIHNRPIYKAVWNDDESQVLTWGEDNTMRVWNATTGIEQFKLTFEERVSGVEWNRDGSQVLTRDWNGVVTVLDTATGIEQLRFTHEDGFSGAAWNGDGTRILTWSSAGTVNVWDAIEGEGIFTLHGEPVVVAQWSQDGRQVFFIMQDGSFRVVNSQMTDLLENGCKHAIRNFTWSEWQSYFQGQEYRPVCKQWPVHPSVLQGQ